MNRSIDRISLTILFVVVATSSVGAIRTSPTVNSSATFTTVTTLAVASKDHDLLKDPQDALVSRQSGTTYVADAGHHQIRAVLTSGEVRLVAGSGSPGFVDGAATSARFKAPQALVVDAVRNVIYVADTGNNVIRSIGQDGTVRTFAGSGRSDGRDGAAAEAGFKSPAGLALDASGNVYVADSGNDKIRRVTPAGVVTTVAGAGLLKNPRGIVVDNDGVIYVADTTNHIIRKIANGIVSTLAGTGHPGYVDGAALLAEFKEPSSIAIDDDGSLLVADTKNHVIRRIVIVGSDVNVSTIAGNGHPGFIDGDVALAQFNEPAGIAVEGAIYVADAKNDAIRLILPNVSATAIDPRSGPSAGGTRVRILGAGFVSGLTTVSFGGTPATEVSFISSTELEALAPSGVAGFVDVRVSTPAGTSRLANAFRYVEPPTIASLAPVRGAVAGGRTITISGANFIDGETTVTFGNAVASLVHVVSPTTLTAVTPAHASGVVDVSVTTPGGSATLSTAFRYLDPPVMTSFTPQQGRTGTTVAISGQNFDSDPSGNVVSIGGFLAPIVSTSPTLLVITVPSGAVTGKVTVTTDGGSVTSGANFVVFTYTSIAVSPAVTTIDVGETVQLTASGTLPNGTTEQLSTEVTWTSADPTIASVDAAGVVHALSGGTTTITATYHGLSASASVTSRAGVPLPPDPSTIATPPDPTVVSSLLEEVRFLYTGPNAIQTGVAPETIQERRAAVLHGQVLKRNGLALSGVTVTVLGHPEYGQTLSRADGYYDLVVNGGGPLTLKYERAENISAQRLVNSSWGQQRTVDDVVLVEYDSAVSTIAMNAAQMQVVRGSISSDVDGARRATLLFPASTTASIVLPDGSLQSMPALNIRATEFSVGSNGPRALPAALPPTSGYTYCVELSADEAVAAGATEVRFSRSVSMYVENFVGFPVGGAVPVGYYDRTRGAWIASENGKVMKILAVVGNSAQIDADGNGVADSSSQLTALGITLAEQQKLATLYAPGQTLWRVPITHFTPYDANWPYIPEDADSPGQPGPTSVRGAERPCKIPFRSTVDCHNRTLAEEIPIVGTPFSLLYDSGRVSRSQYQLDVNLTGPSYPASVKAVHLRVSVAGRQFDWTFPPQPNQKFTFVWDGIDAYGRHVTGMRDALVDLGYVYPARFANATLTPFTWASASGVPLNVTRTGLEFTVHQKWTVPLGHLDVAPTGFGAWSFSHQRFFDARGYALYDENRNRLADPLGTGRVNVRVVAGTGTDASGESIPATSASIFPRSVAPTSDGGFYVAESTRVRFVDSFGRIRTVAGGGSGAPTAPDGSVAVGSPMSVRRIAVGPDDSLFIVEDSPSCRVRRVVNGLLTTVAGNGQCASSGAIDGKLATTVAVNAGDLVVGSDGTLYLAEGSRVTAIGPDRIIRTIAGLGGVNAGYGGDGGPALSATISAVYIAVGRDGTVYFVNGTSAAQSFYVRKVGVDGIIRGVAGRNPPGQVLPIEDGTDAKSGELWSAGGLAVTDNDTVLVTENDFPYRRVRAIAPDGKVTTLAGTGGFTVNAPMNGSLARTILLGMNTFDPAMVRVGPDGNAYVTQPFSRTIVKTEPLFLPSGSGEIVNPSEDGSQGYVFAGGRHVRTVDTITGATLFSFVYDEHGYLVTVNDANGEVTRIERDAHGDPTAIVAPGGQRTALEVHGGVLTSVRNPAGESYSLGYHDFLLTSRRDPRGILAEFTYDGNGRLVRDADAAGGFISLVQTGDADDYSVERTSAEGRTIRYALKVRPDRVEERTTTDAASLVTHSLRRDGSTDTALPDGTMQTLTETADPRFGSIVPLFSTSTRLPSGKTLVAQHTRNVQLADRNNPLSLLSSTDVWSINGKSLTSQFVAATRHGTVQSAAGRTATFDLDSIGRIVSSQTAGLAPVTTAYNSQGLAERIVTGSRRVIFTYNDRRELTTVTDPLLRTVAFEYDDGGRVTRQTLPDGRAIAFDYDVDGNLISITPPGRSAHRFSYNAANLNDAYVPPPVDAGEGATRYTYNKDRQLVSMTRPDGQAMTIGYDLAGRIATIATPDGTYRLTYDIASGKVLSTQGPHQSGLEYGYDGSVLTQVKWVGEVGGTVTYVYDSDLRLASQNGISFAHDMDGLLMKAGALTLARNAQNGALTGSSLLGVTDSYTYNDFGEVIGYVAMRSGATLLSLDYARDNGGRIIRETEQLAGSSVDRSYEYDIAGRLQRVRQAGSTIAEYDYDSNGNRTVHRYLGGTSSAAYDTQDRLLTYDDTSYTYTANGELKTATTGGVTTTFDYTISGNLRGVDMPGRTIQYIIDAGNRRVGKKINGTLTQGWLYDDGRVIAEVDGSGAVIKQFVYGARTNIPDYMTMNGATYRFIADSRGSPRLIVNTATGIAEEKLDYDEFGRLRTDSNPGLQPFGFAGGLYDRDTGLLHFGAREYDPRTGRWTSQDPIHFAGHDTNLYVYVYNDPINEIDPAGLYSLLDFVEDAANFSAGYGDNLTFGLTNVIRDHVGGNEGIDRCGTLYSAGEWAGVATSTAIGAAGGLRAAGAKAAGQEFSHWIPGRVLKTGPGWLREGFGLSRANGNYVSAVEHALNDPYRYRFMPRAWKAANQINPAVVRQLNRLPNAIVGVGAGAGYGAESAALNAAGCGCQ